MRWELRFWSHSGPPILIRLARALLRHYENSLGLLYQGQSRACAPRSPVKTNVGAQWCRLGWINAPNAAFVITHLSRLWERRGLSLLWSRAWPCTCTVPRLVIFQLCNKAQSLPYNRPEAESQRVSAERPLHQREPAGASASQTKFIKMSNPQILLSLTSAPDGTVHNFNFSSLASAAALVVTAASLYCLIKVSDCVRAAVVRNSSHPLCQILINLFKRRKRIIPSCPWKACFVFAKSANSLLSCVNPEWQKKK